MDATSRLAELNDATAMAHEDIARKKLRVALTPLAHNFSPELLELLSGNSSGK
jgi:hypothetical protein